jgi:hypothetical protein
MAWRLGDNTNLWHGGLEAGKRKLEELKRNRLDSSSVLDSCVGRESGGPDAVSSRVVSER